MNTDELFIKQLELSGNEIQNKLKILNSLSDINYSDGYKRKVKSQRKYLLLTASVAIVLTLVLSTIVYAFVNLVFGDMNFDKGLKKADEAGQTTSLNLSTKDKNITLNVKGIISDNLRTVILVSVSGELPPVEDEDDEDFGPANLESMNLRDENGNEYQYKGASGGYFSNDPNKDMRLEFEGIKNHDVDSLTLYIASINGITGVWEINIPIKVIPSHEFYPNIVYEENGVTFAIDKIVFAATDTELTCRYGPGHFMGFTKVILSNSIDSVKSNSWSADNNAGAVEIHFPTFPMDRDITLTIVVNDKEQTTFSVDIPASTFKK